jgi:hypothetical protein
MSHDTTIKSKVVDAKAIIAAAKALGMTVKENAQWRGYYGKSEDRAEYVLSHKDCPYDLALRRQKDGTYSMTGDFWEHVRRGQKTLSDVIGKNGDAFTQQTNLYQARASVELDGFFVEQTVDQDDVITLTCTLYE